MMNKKITLFLAATALLCLPAFSQVSTADNGIDSLAGFNIQLAMHSLNLSNEPAEADNQIKMAERNYIDKEFHLGIYDPNYHPSNLRQNNSNSVQTSCSNVDFETGDFSNWDGMIGLNDSASGSSNWFHNTQNGIFSTTINAPVSDANARHTIITSAYGNDPYGSFPGVPTGSGNYTIRLGGQTPNCQAEVLSQTFTVSPSSTSFAYRYAVVLNDNSHPANWQPFFKIEVLDPNNQPISNCTQYYVIAGPNAPGFFLSPTSAPQDGTPVYYKPWTTVNFDLSAYVNQNITVRFTVAGCTQTGHFGYAYIDCACSSFAANEHFCPGNTFLYLDAPTGYGSYQWFDQNHVAIPGATNDTLLVNNPVVGDTFSVYLISGVDTSCHNLLPIVLQYTHILPNATTTNPTCFGYNDGSATANGTVGFAPYTYTWLTSPNQSTQTITGLSPGQYVVHMTDSLGCEAFDTVNVAQTPRLDTTQAFTNFCQGNPNMILSVPPGYANYVWMDNLGDTLSNNSNSVVIANPVSGTVYNVVLIPPPGCPVYDSVVIPPLVFTTIYPNPTSTSPTCFGYSDGSVTANGSNGIGPYSYSWNTVPPQTTQTVNNLPYGSYIVHITDSLGCTASDTILVTQPARVDTAAFSYHYCPGNPNVIFTAPAGYSNYVWTDPNGNPIANSSPINTAVITNPVVGSEYHVILTPPPGCPVFDSIVIPVLQPSVITSTASATGVSCYGYTDGTTSASGANGILPYNYLWNTNPVQTNANLSNLAAGQYIVHIADSMGCLNIDTVVVTHPARLDTSLFTYNYCVGDPHMVMYAPAGFNSYTWIGPNNSDTIPNSPDNYLLINSPQVGDQYLCILNDPPACPIYDSTKLNFSPPTYFFNPDSTVNVFTPNGDLKNDIFYPYYDYSVARQTAVSGQPAYDFFDLHIKYYEIWIYDRWGNQVFYSNDYKFGWDGTVDKNKNVTDGVYFWVCKMTSNCSYDDSNPIVKKGFVHLIR